MTFVTIVAEMLSENLVYGHNAKKMGSPATVSLYRSSFKIAKISPHCEKLTFKHISTDMWTDKYWQHDSKTCVLNRIL